MFTKYLLLLLLSIIYIRASNNDFWKSKTIYQLLTDRFNTINKNYPCNNLHDYCGGTFQGVTEKLEYIQNLGFDAIWISPIVMNSRNGYHGYWTTDHYKVNPNFGGAAALKDLITKAHLLNISVMVDVVANHVASVGDNFNLISEPFNNADKYHSYCNIDYRNQNSVESCRIENLPDINTEDEKVINFFNTWIKWVVTEFDFDAIRIDTVKHVRKEFWGDFVKSSGVFAMGEIFHGDPAYVAPYQKFMPSVFNYPMYYTIKDVFASKMSMQAIPDRLLQSRKEFIDTTVLGVFVDNHDNPRFLSLNSDISLFKNAITLAFLTDGIPVLYYGSEQAFNGGEDPNNREVLWNSNFNQSGDLFKFVASLNALRRRFGEDFYTELHTPLFTSNNLHVFQKGKLIVAVSNIGSQGILKQTVSFPNSNSTAMRHFTRSEIVPIDQNSFTVTIHDGQPANKSHFYQIPIFRNFTKKMIFGLIAILTIFSLCVNSKECKSPPPSYNVDLSKYAGVWYEIGTTVNVYLTYEANCTCTKATYTPLKDYINVENYCKRQNDSISVGKAVSSGNETRPGDFIVSMPGRTNTQVNYIVVNIWGNYSYALVGNPCLDTFWVLSKRNHMSTRILSRILEYAESVGFHPQDLGFKITSHLGCRKKIISE